MVILHSNTNVWNDASELELLALKRAFLIYKLKIFLF